MSEFVDEEFDETEQDVAKEAFDKTFKVKVIGPMISDCRIGDGAFRTLLWILFRSGRKGLCWASYNNLAKERSISPATMYRHMAELKKLGWIDIERNRKGDTSFKIPKDMKMMYPPELVNKFFDLLKSDRSIDDLIELKSEDED